MFIKSFLLNKKALLAVGVALFIPLICYFIIKQVSEQAVVMPGKYRLDTVVQRKENGRDISDTLWHTTRNIRLVNQLGDTVALYDLKGKVIVMDVFFTSCRSICPALTTNMRKMQQSFLKGGDMRQKVDTSLVHFLSFSIDPETDSVPRLRKWADAFQVNHDSWWFLTGKKDSIYRFLFEELQVDRIDTAQHIDSLFPHTSYFVLMDQHHKLRGYYNGLDTFALSKLARDIGLLTLEKDRTQPNALLQSIMGLAWLWLIGGVAIAVFLSYFVQRRRKETP